MLNLCVLFNYHTSYFFQIIEYGDLQLQMTYLQSAERLTVVVLKARNLRPLDEAKGNASKYHLFMINCYAILVYCGVPGPPCLSKMKSCHSILC